MTSIQEFKCIFCKESFDNKEELQIHFRKHGDPNFNQKNKASGVQNSSDSNKDESELVGCDVCSEVFPTISKAITHKHKVHPEHDAKYFCPWCGKLFTMKHLYNKHIQANHGYMEISEENTFHCDACNVNFHLPAAVLYHNKFFHRQDTDIPLFGLSKKLKMYSQFQEALPIYYCSFCGEEYDNKVNLHKHSTDEHSDENQRPDVVLRCPLCDAVFYHLDAYELHLMFHSADDLYSERSEMADQISEYSLESVPPIMEKVEHTETQDANSMMENGMDGMGVMEIEDFLEQALEEPDVVAKKNKKHKKHKKSKKSAITLDEFLNMNKDVFGEGLDFQGVEEVPTRVVTKRLKVAKKIPPTSSEISPELEKLRKHGIIIKKKPGPNISIPKKGLPNKSLKPITQTIKSNKIHSEPIVSTSDDTIDKLINQSNNQIKIVKKSNKDISGNMSTTKYNKFHEESEEMECDSTKKDVGEFTSNEGFIENIPSTVENSDKEAAVEETALGTKCHIPVQNNNETHDDDIDKTSSEGDITEDDSRNGTQIQVRNIDSVKVESTSNIMENDTGNDIDDMLKNPDENLIIANNYENQSEIDTTLKRLSHLITVKPVLPNKNPLITDVDKTVPPILHVTAKHNVETSTICQTAAKVCDADLKNNEFVKSMSSQAKSNIQKNTSQESEFDNKTNKSTKLQTSTKNITRSDDSNNLESKLMMTNTNKVSNTPDTDSNEKDKQDASNLLKHLSGITAKPVNANKFTNKNNSSLPIRTVVNKNVRRILPQREIVNNEEIEIYNIDDSDDEIDQEHENNKKDTKPTEVLKNLSKNIIIKSSGQSTPEKNKINSQELQKEETSCDKKTLSIEKSQSGISNNTSVADLPNRIAAKPFDEKNLALRNVLKNLGKNVTVKSNQLSPSQSARPQDKNVLNCKYANNSDTSNRIKITEITDEDCGDESENDHTSDNVIVESPEDSQSDKEMNDDTDVEDFENQIQANMLKRDDDQAQSPQTQDAKQPDNTMEADHSSEGNLNLDITKSLGDQISIKPVKQIRKETKHESITNADQMCGQTSYNSVMNQKISTSNQVNKQVMVKTFQTQTNTVIQEITTTVTKTIKTVNKSLSREVQNVNNYTTSTSPQKVQGMRMHQQAQNLQGIVVRQSTPTIRPKIRNTLPAKSAVGTTVRHSSPVIPVGTSVRPTNQIVPIRPRSNVVRPCNPRMPSVPKLRPSICTQTGVRVVRPPRVTTDGMTAQFKRPNMEDASGPFSCFKKPKESLIPVSDVPTFNNGDSESITEYSSVCKSNSMSTTSSLKGNSVIASSQMKSEVNITSQQLCRLNNTSGIKVTKTSQSKQAQVNETSEVSATQRTTLEAIQKLQKQGLLVKKPRLDIKQDSDGSDHSGNDGSMD